MPVEMVDLVEAYRWLNYFKPNDVGHCTEA